MKITGVAPGRWYPDRGAIALFPSKSDYPVIEKLFSAKSRKDVKEGGESGIEFELEVAVRPRTDRQLRTVWALIKIIFVSMNGEPPTHEEAYDLYLDILDLYANKKPNRFNGSLRPVHISESDVEDAAVLIEACMGILVEYCDLSMDAQSEVRKLFFVWTEQRGGMERDPLDYDERGALLSVAEWRKRHKVSDASGIGGYLEAAHIVSRGAGPGAIEDVRNLVMLTADEHRYMHQYGWDAFLKQWPHLRGRILRARQLFGGE